MEFENIKQEPEATFVLILPSREKEKVLVKREIFEEADSELSCKFCHKEFKNQGKLREHLVNHKAKVECSICSKMINKNRLKRHMKIHDQNRSRNFSCQICSKSFMTKYVLQQYLKIHKAPFECDECGKKFAHKRRLDDHKLNHNERNPFKCDLCPKTFSRKENLQMLRMPF
jgi:uncharacterized Zn-finger protein